MVIPRCVNRYSPALMLGIEIWLTIWWIISIGVSAHYFGGVACRGYFYDSSVSMCHMGKAVLAFSVINLVLSVVSLTLVSVFSIHPVVSDKNSGGITRRLGFSVGGIFLASNAAIDNDYGSDTDVHDASKEIQREDPFYQTRESV